jgi:hypothetical protein
MHAIKHEFEYNTEKNDPERIRVYCSKKVEEGCRWRLRAKTMDDEVTVQISCDFVLFFFYCTRLLLIMMIN